MKILYTNPFGVSLNWNARMHRMIELLRAQKHEVKTLFDREARYTGKTSEYIEKFQRIYDKFQPDVIFSHGAGLASNFVEKYGYKTVIDLGSFDSSEYMIQKSGLVSNYKELMAMKDNALFEALSHSGIYDREKYTVENVKAVITFEGWENRFAKRIFPEAKIIANSPLYIKDVDHKLPWKLREDKAIAVAAKWGRKSKNGKFIHHFNNENWLKQNKKPFKIWRVGHSGGWEECLPHEDIMKLMGQVKVVVCPMFTGANMVIAEAIKMGANVVIHDAHPFQVYTHPRLTWNADNNVYNGCYVAIERAFQRHYSSQKGLPTEKMQLRRLIEILEL